MLLTSTRGAIGLFTIPGYLFDKTEQNATPRVKNSSGEVPRHVRCQKFRWDVKGIDLVGNILNF